MEEIKDNLRRVFLGDGGKAADRSKDYTMMKQEDTDLTAHRPLMAFMGHTVEKPQDEGKNATKSLTSRKYLDYLAALSDAERQKFQIRFW